MTYISTLSALLPFMYCVVIEEENSSGVGNHLLK